MLLLGGKLARKGNKLMLQTRVRLSRVSDRTHQQLHQKIVTAKLSHYLRCPFQRKKVKWRVHPNQKQMLLLGGNLGRTPNSLKLLTRLWRSQLWERTHQQLNRKKTTAKPRLLMQSHQLTCSLQGKKVKGRAHPNQRLSLWGKLARKPNS